MPIPARSSAVGTRLRGRTVLLSPFDSLIWYRDRLERLFDVRHRLEAYTPKEKRIYGYFAMPVLDGTRIVGLVDPGRRGEVLVAKQVTLLRPDAAAPVAAGDRRGGIVGRLHRRARWSGWSRRRPGRRCGPRWRRPLAGG